MNVPQVDFTLEDIKKIMDERFIAEREITKSLISINVQAAVQEGVANITAQFQSFINDNFDPAMEAIDQRFDRLEDRVDTVEGRLSRVSADVNELRIDTRHVKQALRSGHPAGA